MDAHFLPEDGLFARPFEDFFDLEFARSGDFFGGEKLDVEDERGVRGNHAARAAFAVAHVRRNREGALAARPHAGEALFPPLNHAAFAEREGEGLTARDARIKDGAVFELARIVNGDAHAGLGFDAVAHLGVENLQSISHCCVRLRSGAPLDETRPTS